MIVTDFFVENASLRLRACFFYRHIIATCAKMPGIERISNEIHQTFCIYVLLGPDGGLWGAGRIYGAGTVAGGGA